VPVRRDLDGSRGYVRRDDHWHDGELSAWRRDAGRWHGFVCYAESAGLRWLEWVPVERVRPSWAESFPNRC
jgi:hypothetical protein